MHACISSPVLISMYEAAGLLIRLQPAYGTLKLEVKGKADLVKGLSLILSIV